MTGACHLAGLCSGTRTAQKASCLAPVSRLRALGKAAVLTACPCCMQELCSHPFWNTALPERDLPAEPMLQVGACLCVSLCQASSWHLAPSTDQEHCFQQFLRKAHLCLPLLPHTASSLT